MVSHLFCACHQELPSQSANLSRPDTLPSPNFLSSRFGTHPKNFNSQRVPCFGCTFRINVAFGGAHAPWSAANDFMETLQVQPAGAVAPTLPASTVLSGTPTGDDSFALTLGRALENIPNLVQDGSSITPKASPRGKEAASDSPDSPSMAGILFNCFVTNILQPAPPVALSTGAQESTVSLPGPESTTDSPPDFAFSLATSEGKSSANPGTLSIPAAKGGGAAPSTLSAWTGKGVGTTGTGKAEASKSIARERGQVAFQSRSLVPATGQIPPEETATPQPVSAPPWFPVLQDTSVLSQPVEQKVGGALSESKQVQGSNPVSARQSEPRQAPLDSPSLTDSWPQISQLDPAQMQAVPLPPSGQSLQAASNPTASLGQTGQSAPASSPEASDPSKPFSATGHPALARFSSLMGDFVGADLQAASHPTASLGRTEQTAPASGADTNAASTPFSATGHPALAEFSSRLGKFAGADLQTAPNPTLSLGQVGQAAPASGPEASAPSTPFSATDHPKLAGFSGLLDKFAEADLQAASNPTASLGQTGQSAPASDPEASAPSTPLSATDHPALAQFSGLLDKFAGADLQAASDATLPPGQVGQASPAVAPEANDSSIPISGTDHRALAQFSNVLGKFAGVEISVKVSGNESQPATATDKFTTKSTPVPVGTLNGGLRMTAVDSVLIPVAPKAENLVNTPAKVTLHSAPTSSSVATEVAWQKGNEPEVASAQAPLSSSASPVPSPQVDANSQPPSSATTLRNDAAPQAHSIQSPAAVSADSGESAAYANPSDPSASGQGKSGQQSGTASGDNPAVVTPIAPSIATNPAPDSTANLLTAHAPSVPASHTATSAPQIPPSSSQPPATLSAWQNYDGGAGKIVRSASLSDTANGAEMHVELRSGALGPLEVHAVVHEGSVGAEIHVQGQEAHTLLAAGLPSLERALGERNLRVENIAVYQDQAGGGMSGGEKQDSQSSSYTSAQHQALPWDNPPQPSRAASGSSDGEEIANPAAGLSIRA